MVKINTKRRFSNMAHEARGTASTQKNCIFLLRGWMCGDHCYNFRHL